MSPNLVRVTAPSTPSDASAGAARTPISLWAAVVLVGAQGAAVLVYAASELVYGVWERSGMAMAVALFLGAYGAGLGAAAWFLLKRRSSARAPIVLAQLLHLGIAWNARGEPLTPYALAAAWLSALTLLAVMWPSTTRVLSAGLGEDDPA